MPRASLGIFQLGTERIYSNQDDFRGRPTPMQRQDVHKVNLTDSTPVTAHLVSRKTGFTHLHRLYSRFSMSMLGEDEFKPV
jgi:hypothetical protein